MIQSTGYTGRPLTPPPGAPARELLVARFHGHARRLVWCALVLVATAAATGWFYDNLPAPLTNWMLLSAAAAVVLLLVVIPFWVWATRVYEITTRRVVVTRGILIRRRQEMLHARGYTVSERRGPVQRMWGAGDLVLENGVDASLTLADVPSAALVHEVLVDQVEVSQILAHRDDLAGTASSA